MLERAGQFLGRLADGGGISDADAVVRGGNSSDDQPLSISDVHERRPGEFDSIRRIAGDDLRVSFGQIEDRLADGRSWLFGRWTILDAYLLWIWFRAVGSGLSGDEFPRVDGLARRCQKRPDGGPHPRP